MPARLTTVCEELFEKINVDALLTHPVDKSIITTIDGVRVVTGKIVVNPRISTGGGDNLNSGFFMFKPQGVIIILSPTPDKLI